MFPSWEKNNVSFEDKLSLLYIFLKIQLCFNGSELGYLCTDAETRNKVAAVHPVFV